MRYPSALRVAGATCLAVTVANLLPAGPLSRAEAKVPGKVHCYGSVCHRVRSIEETRRLVGRTLVLDASYYDDAAIDRFNRNAITSNGERFDASSPARVSSSDLPDGTELLLRNPANGLTSHVRVNDFGPFHGSRLIDVTRRVAEDLDFRQRGVTPLEVTVIAAPKPDEAAYRRWRALPPTLGHIGVVDDGAVAKVVRRLIGSDRRLALMTRRIDVPERDGTLIARGLEQAAETAEPVGDGATFVTAATGRPEEELAESAPPQAIRPAAAAPRTRASAWPAALSEMRARRDTAAAAPVPAMTVAAVAASHGWLPAVRARPLVGFAIEPTLATTVEEAGPRKTALLEARLPSGQWAFSVMLAALAGAGLYFAWAMRTSRPVADATPARRRPRLAARGAAATHPASAFLAPAAAGSGATRRGISPGMVPGTTPGVTHEVAPELRENTTTAAAGGEMPPASMIGAGVEIVGDIFALAAVRIAGSVRGNVVARTVEIAAGGRVQGQVAAERVMVDGTLVGNASSALLGAGPTGRLIGEFEAQRFAIAHGAAVEGRLRTLALWNDDRLPTSARDVRL